KAVSTRSGMVKPMKSVPEAFTKDRQGTSCSLRACYSKSTPTQESVPRLSVLLQSSTNGSKSQPPVKSSFLTPYKKSDTSMSGTGTNPETCNTVNQASRKPMPRFIPKCLSVHQPDLVKSKTTASPTLNKEGASENQQKSKGNEKADIVDIAKLVEEARTHQAELLKVKEKTKVSPDPGRLYTVKAGNRRVRMRDVIKLQTRCEGKPQHNLRPRFGDVRAATAVQHKFYLPDFYTNLRGHVYVGDGAYLVPDNELYAGKEELF
ncbi:uncharacterized protein LOC110444535, partial [Mizuhopecten yessoensis]|uniref:uncharacterized protein LOC110444535 n=1 Tax=Mizuhopecten yessoensis TaxID=6573 RepID=UPI000B457EFF